MSDRTDRPLVIFGTGELAELCHYYFTNDSDRDVVAFTVDRSQMMEDTFIDLPVVSFTDLKRKFPPKSFDLFIAVGYSRLNATRAEKFLAAKEQGYRLASYVSSKCHSYDDLVIGENCLVMEGTQIQPFVKIGNNVIIWSGCLISHHVSIEDHAFVAAHAVISGRVHIEPYCFIGVNATIREKIVLARKSIVGAGALILRSTEENQSYVGTATAESGIPSDRFQALL